MSVGSAGGFRLGVVAGETGRDLDRTVQFAVDHDLPDLEVDEAWGTPICRAGPDVLARARDVIAGAGRRVSMIGAPTFKTLVVAGGDPSDIAAMPELAGHRADLEGSFRAAHALGCERVRVYSCRREAMVGLGNPSPREPDGGDVPSDRLAVTAAVLRDAAQRAEAQGLTICLENVRSCFGNSGRNTARILEAVDHAALRVIWDPPNDFVSGGDPYPRGYEFVRPWMVHVHAKDARVRDRDTGLTSWEAMGRGAIDWVGQFAALITDGYAGSVSLETHWHPQGRSRLENSHDSLAGLRELLMAARRAAR